MVDERKPNLDINKKKAPDPAEAQATNALWRIPEWFPNIDPKLAENLRLYHEELLKFNLKLNLISRQTEREADEAHFADCLLAAQIMVKENFGSVLFDVGSGNGMPGLIIGLMRPNVQIMLVESDSRKCEFLKHMIHAFKMPNVKVMNTRLESMQGSGIECAISRGLASISKTCLLFNKIFPKGGKFYHMKGVGWSSEIASIPSQLISVWSPRLVGEYSLPVSQARRAIVCTEKQ